MTVENSMNTFDLERSIKKPSCFQCSKPHWIELILTNKKELCKSIDATEVGISDHHSVIVTALKSQLFKGNSKRYFMRIINYNYNFKL